MLYRLDGTDIEFATYGVEACIIDFTLSRITHDGVVIYNDIGQDEELFTATGDYQFEIYRLMQDKNGYVRLTLICDVENCIFYPQPYYTENTVII